MDSNSYRQRLQQKLEQALAPIHMEILDDSARHKGHAGHLPAPKASADTQSRPSEVSAKEDDPKGETHFKVTIVSAAFRGLSRLERHRLVYQTVDAELKERVHALTIRALTPEENSTQG